VKLKAQVDEEGRSGLKTIIWWRVDKIKYQGRCSQTEMVYSKLIWIRFPANIEFMKYEANKVLLVN